MKLSEAIAGIILPSTKYERKKIQTFEYEFEVNLGLEFRKEHANSTKRRLTVCFFFFFFFFIYYAKANNS